MTGERFRITNYEALTRKHGLVCTSPREVKIVNVLLAIGNIIGSHHIRAASHMDKKLVIFVSDVHMVNSVVERGLFVEPDLYLTVSSLQTPATKINITNVPPFIKNEELCAQLRRFGTVV